MNQWKKALIVADQTPRCGAKARTRNGEPCKSPAMANGRCRLHGGKSTGAPCGKKHGRYRHGKYTKETKQNFFNLNFLLKESKRIIKEVEDLF